MTDSSTRFYTPTTEQERKDYKANVLTRYAAKVGRKYMDRVDNMTGSRLVSELFKATGDRADYVTYVYWTR